MFSSFPYQLCVSATILVQICLTMQDAETSPYVLFCTFFTVSRINLNGSDYSVVVDSIMNSGVQDVDYHLRLNKVFWIHITNGTLFQANLDGSNPTVISYNLSNPRAIAVDWINDKVYFSSTDPNLSIVSPNYLSVYDISSEEISVITLDTPYDKLYDIAVDPFNQMLYWTDSIRLVRSTLTGQNIEVIFTPSCGPNYIYLNVKLYWTQQFCSPEGIYSLDLTTMQLSVIVDGNNTDIFYNDVIAYMDTIYWTGLDRLYSAPINGGNITEIVREDTTSFTSNNLGMALVHPDIQPEISNTSNNNCDAPLLTINCSSTSPNVSLTQNPTISQPMSSHPPTSTESSDNLNLIEENPLAFAFIIVGVFIIFAVAVCLLTIIFAIIIYRKSLKTPKVQKISDGHNAEDIVTSQNIVYATTALESYQSNQQDTTENELEYATVEQIVEQNVEQNPYERIEDNVGYELDDLNELEYTTVEQNIKQRLHERIEDNVGYELDELTTN